MTSEAMGPIALSRLSPHIDALLGARDAFQRDRALLAAVFALEGAGAAALWKPAVGGRHAWRCVLERGPADALPSAGEIDAFLRGTLGGDLSGRRVVMVAGAGVDAVALVLGDVENTDGRLDAVEALLGIRCALETRCPGDPRGEHYEDLGPALPPSETG